MWLEILYPRSFDLEDIPGMLRVLDSYMLTDCKSLYDALVRVESSGLQLTEKRTAVEVLFI